MRRWAFRLSGAVQGVGLRPRVRRLAAQHGLAGEVRNGRRGVHLELEGAREAVDSLLAALVGDEVHALDEGEIAPRGTVGFRIAESDVAGGARATVPPDLAPCARCRDEVRGDGRRRGYVFTSCTSCGPRWSISTDAPWDRERTTMASFAPCAACLLEHDAEADPRSHAQTLACPACGPHLSFVEGNGVAVARDALARAVEALLAGRVLALKGLGGYQLVVDATRESSVALLRLRKAREARPFAVLFADVDAVARVARVSTVERAALESPAAPIVLLSAGEGHLLAPSVAPGSRLVGAMLPASLLHERLAVEVGRPLVCTSGNLAEAPMVFDDDDARSALAGLADATLAHDRRIARGLDDSVLRVGARGPILLRRARGYAPRPLERREPGPTVLALGAHMKATVALALDDEIQVSAHIGDLTSPEALDRLEATARDLLRAADVRPDAVACDLHPDLPSSRLAEALARELGAALVRVPHHAAHVAALAVEHGVEGPLFGLAFDGMGYGEDGQLWGGEALFIEGSRAHRTGHLRSFRLPGSDKAAREPRRSALGALFEAGLPLDALSAWFGEGEVAALTRAIERGLNAPFTSSVGRLFDVVAAISGLCGVSRFEAEAAMRLEQHATGARPRATIDPSEASPGVYDWAPLLAAILERDAAPEEASNALHAWLASVARSMAERAGAERCALAGGCFQNVVLEELVTNALSDAGIRALVARALPPNDGGLSVGQTLLAARRLAEGTLTG